MAKTSRVKLINLIESKSWYKDLVKMEKLGDIDDHAIGKDICFFLVNYKSIETFIVGYAKNSQKKYLLISSLGQGIIYWRLEVEEKSVPVYCYRNIKAFTKTDIIKKLKSHIEDVK